MNLRVFSFGAAVLFVSLCIYSTLSVGSYPPPIQGENEIMGHVVKLIYSTPGISYFLYLIKNWRRDLRHG